MKVDVSASSIKDSNFVFGGQNRAVNIELAISCLGDGTDSMFFPIKGRQGTTEFTYNLYITKKCDYGVQVVES